MLKAVKQFFIKVYQQFKLNLQQIYHATGSAHEIALGASIGAFWGVFPTFGLSTLLTLVIHRFLNFNVIVALAAAFISNPITSPFLLWISYQTGNQIVHSNHVFQLETWEENIYDLGLALFLGSMIISTLTAILVYFLTIYLISKRNKNEKIS